MYALATAFISIPATLILGFPLSIYAESKNILTTRAILFGAAITGGVAFIILSVVYLQEISLSIFIFCGIIGAVGGLFNGYVFSEYINSWSDRKLVCK